MKKLLLAGIAAIAFCGAPVFAADMPVKAAPIAPMLNWTGCYIGGNVGGAWAHKSATITSDGGAPVNAPIGSLTADGWAYGGQIGCDYQFNNNWAVGIRGMWDGSNMSGSNLNTNPAVIALTDHVKIDSFGTVVGKLGYLLNPTIQLYGLAGVAWVQDHYFFTTFPVAGNQTRTGYDLGVGISWMFARNWDIWIEYNYMGFGTKNVTLTDPNGIFATQGVDYKQNVSKILVGIDYRFDWGKAPVVAKY